MRRTRRIRVRTGRGRRRLEADLRHKASARHKATAEHKGEERNAVTQRPLGLAVPKFSAQRATRITAAHTASATGTEGCGDGVMSCRDEACDQVGGAQRWELGERRGGRGREKKRAERAKKEERGKAKEQTRIRGVNKGSFECAREAIPKIRRRRSVVGSPRLRRREDGIQIHLVEVRRRCEAVGCVDVGVDCVDVRIWVYLIFRWR